MPAVPPVTTPDDVTEATPAADELHVPPLMGLLNVILLPLHTEVAPDMAPGAATTVIVVVRVPHELV